MLDFIISAYKPEMTVGKGILHPILLAKGAPLGNMGTLVHLVLRIKTAKMKKF